jgi:transposase
MGTRTLTSQDWDALDDLRFSTTDKAVFRNATIILMSSLGRSKFDLAYELGCSPGTVDIIRRKYREQGLTGLTPRTPPGKKARATPAYRVALRAALQTPPQQLGFGFSVWSIARLGEHLKRQTGIAFCEDHLRRLVHAEGFSFQRPKHTMKGKRDEVAFEKAKKQLETLKKKPWPTSRTKS